jgi:hypothetical protein
MNARVEQWSAATVKTGSKRHRLTWRWTIRAVLQCENRQIFPSFSNPPPAESRIGPKLYEMLILGVRTRGEKAKTAGHSTWRKRPALRVAGIRFPSAT